jgi:hypothetical protein
MILLTSNLGFILLAIWLILEGATDIFGLTFNGLNVIKGILAIAAGILILIGR